MASQLLALLGGSLRSGTPQPLPDLPFPAWQLLLTSCHPRAVPATLTHLLITELLISQASRSGDRRGVRVLTHLVIPGARMELSLELQSRAPLLPRGAPHPSTAL